MAGQADDQPDREKPGSDCDELLRCHLNPQAMECAADCVARACSYDAPDDAIG